MHARKVRLTAAGFALALFALAAGVAWRAQARRTAAAPSASSPVSSAQREHDGRSLYELHCVRCHALDEFAETYQGPGSGLAIFELLEFLAEHGASDDDEDRAIARFMATPLR